jgi:hypothetical protein
MTAAYRLKGLGWFASCTAIVIGFYLVSLQVASERNKLDSLNGKIRTAERDIRALETEFDTRANLAQLERWNGDVLALSAPTAGQFVADEAQLAAVSFRPGAAGPDLRTAQLVVPAAPVIPVAPEPQLAQAARPAAPVAVAQAAPARPAVARVARVAQAVRAAVAPKREVAMLDRKLLSDSTLGSILSGARAESRTRR